MKWQALASEIKFGFHFSQKKVNFLKNDAHGNDFFVLLSYK